MHSQPPARWSSRALLPCSFHPCRFHPAVDDARFELAHLCDRWGVSWIVSSRESRAVWASQWAAALCLLHRESQAREQKDRDYLFCTSSLCPGKQVTLSHPPGGWEAGLRAPSSPLHWWLLPSLLRAWGLMVNAKRCWTTSHDWLLQAITHLSKNMF